MPIKMLIQIVPRFHPQADDAGEYAFNLARALRADHGIQSQFIACDPERDGPSRVEDFVVQRLRVRSEAGIWNLLSPAKGQDVAVLLHYCPYGYNKTGLPLWLYRGVKSWLEEPVGASASNEKKLITVLHETLQSPLKPWNREFCLRLPQRWLLQQFCRHSKLSATKNHRLQFSQNVVPIQNPKFSAILEDQSVAPGANPDWSIIARQVYVALNENLPGATTDAPSGKVNGGEKRLPPAYASGLKLAEQPVGRLRRPA